MIMASYARLAGLVLPFCPLVGILFLLFAEMGRVVGDQWGERQCRHLLERGRKDRVVGSSKLIAQIP